MNRTLAYLILGSCLLAPAGRAGELEQKRLDNWHHWRGPEANGTAPRADPPIKWNAKTNIKWKAELPGRGSATPIVWGDQVFIVTAIKTERAVEGDDLPKLDPRCEKRTTRPVTYHQFVVVSSDRRTGKLLGSPQAAVA